MLGWDSGLRCKESGRDRFMVSVVQSGNWTRGSGSRGGTRTQPYGLRVQRRVFSTAGVKAHYLGDIVMTREKGDASTRRGKPLPRAFSRDKGTKIESLRASYLPPVSTNLLCKPFVQLLTAIQHQALSL